MKTHVNIVCVKYGTKYNSEHVKRLYRMVEKNISLPFYFYCLSDTDIEDINVIPLDTSLDLESYWWKICLFDLNLSGPVLYFDLDVIIQNNFDHIINQIKQEKILTINGRHYGVYYPYDGNEENILTIPEAKINSSILGFYCNHKDIYNKFFDDLDFNIVFYYGLDRFLSELYFDKFNWIDFSKDYYFRNKGLESYDPKYIESDGYIYDPSKTFCVVSQADSSVYIKMEKYFI